MRAVQAAIGLGQLTTLVLFDQRHAHAEAHSYQAMMLEKLELQITLAYHSFHQDGRTDQDLIRTQHEDGKCVGTFQRCCIARQIDEIGAIA